MEGEMMPPVPMGRPRGGMEGGMMPPQMGGPGPVALGLPTPPPMGGPGGGMSPGTLGGMAQPPPTMGGSPGGMSPGAMQEGATMGKAMQQEDTLQPAQPPQPPQPAQPPQPPMTAGGPPPTVGLGGPRGGRDEMVAGTALTPATPSAMGGGSGSLATATVGFQEDSPIMPVGGGGMPQPPMIGGGEGMPRPPMMGSGPGGMGGGEGMAQPPTIGSSSGGGSMSDEYVTPGGPNTQSLTGANTGGEIAQQFGFDSQEYGGYFTPISDKMKAAGTEAGYTGMLNEQRSQLRNQSGQAKQGLRASLLQDQMMAQQASGASGFAGGGAQQQAMGLARQGRQLQADQQTSQYGRGMYGVRQQIAGRVTAGQQALSSAQQAMYSRALELQKSGASMSGSGGSGGSGGGGTGGGSILDMTATDTAATTSIDSQIGAQGGMASDPTMAGNVSAGAGQGAGSFMDADNQVTGDAYDEMIAQQQQAAQQAAQQQTNNYVPPRPKRVVTNERKANVGIG
tara:strand:+ start:178 stop:1701 length:1524 start_codon:yes stop_codon:yes gene_type:complete